jgi:hypothetical protein
MWSHRTRARWIASALVGLVAIGWLLSLLPLTQAPSLLAAQHHSDTLMLPLGQHSTSWRDALVVDVALGDACAQQRRGSVIWYNQNGSPIRMPITALGDGKMHRYIVAVGAHPGWRGEIERIEVLFPEQAALHTTFRGAHIMRRSPLALDQLLMQVLIPQLPVFPRWPPFVVLVLALLGAALALLMPKANRPQRLQLVGLLVGGCVGVATVLRQLSLVGALLPILGWPPAARANCAPTYHETPQVNAALVAAAARLPDGPVLVLHPDPQGYLVDRARYLFAPRRVDAMQPPFDQATRNRLLAGGYVALVATGPDEGAPTAGWQRVSLPGATPIIWQRAGASLAATPQPPRGALIWLVLALSCVSIGGWGLAGVFGMIGVERLLGAWPIGASLVAWWMFILDWSGLGWSWWAIGLLLLSTGCVAAVVAQPRATALGPVPLPIPPSNRVLVWGGLTLISIIAVGLLLQAVLLPFTDVDTWRAWSFKAQGFFRDGAIAPTLTRYSQRVLDHLTYPPAQPLLQTWGYIAMNGLNERLIKLIFPCWYVACVGLLWLGCKQWGAPQASLGWALLFATTPLVMDHAVLGNADLPFAASYLLGVLLLARWVEQEQWRALAGAVVALAGLAWLKLDGIYLGLLALVVGVLMRCLATPGTLRTRGRSAGAGALAALALLFSYAPWQAYLARLGLQSDLPDITVLAEQGIAVLRQALAVVLEALLLSHANSAWGLLDGSFGALWLVCGGALLWRWQRLRVDPVLRLLVLILIGGLLFYVAIYSLRPYSSIDRYLLHLAPIGVLAAARATATAPTQAPAD